MCSENSTSTCFLSRKSLIELVAVECSTLRQQLRRVVTMMCSAVQVSSLDKSKDVEEFIISQNQIRTPTLKYLVSSPGPKLRAEVADLLSVSHDGQCGYVVPSGRHSLCSSICSRSSTAVVCSLSRKLQRKDVESKRRYCHQGLETYVSDRYVGLRA